MLEEAADELEKVEMRAPDLPIVHAYLATVFERRGDWREACRRVPAGLAARSRVGLAPPLRPLRVLGGGLAGSVPELRALEQPSLVSS